MRRVVLLALLLIGWSDGDVRAEPPPAGSDSLDEALASAGLTRADLGWRARGWWTGYPDVQQKLRHVDDLFAQPLATVPFLRAMGAGVRDFLDPTKAAEKGVRGAGWLHRAAHLVGVDPRFGAMRSYAANLTAELTPFDKAVIEVYRYAQRPTRFVTFGQESPYPLVEQDLQRAAARLPEDVSKVVGRLVLDLLDAQRWADLCWRDVPLDLRARVAARLDLGAEEVDALDYEPAIDDVLRRWDEASLWYAGLKTVEALERARLDLEPLVKERVEALSKVGFEVVTPLGRITVGGTGADVFDGGDVFEWLAVDLGGDDTWNRRWAASDAAHALGAALDLAGDDAWAAVTPFPGTTQGAGVTGVGVLLDARGNDRYYAGGALAQGAGQMGFGALIDLAGDDLYDAEYSAQGCGYFGVGLLLDAGGKDRHRLWSDGQGFGGAGGVGVLADRSGDDVYEALVDARLTSRPSYHTESKVSVSNAQGCSMGRRGDGADGHSWAGGLGMLLDAAGNDSYVAGNWAQGCGYWFGTGLLWDGGGDDAYTANGWAQGSGAHFCVGALVDEDGADTHVVKQGWGPGYGHDFTVGLFVDLGTGNDAYEAGESGLGWSINRSVALFLEAGGDDRYVLTKEGALPGTAVFDKRLLDRGGPSRYWTESVSVGLFLDAGGTDVHPARGADGARRTDDAASDNAKARNRGIAWDTTGTFDLERPQPR
jgi:hypothetical protein